MSRKGSSLANTRGLSRYFINMENPGFYAVWPIVMVIQLSVVVTCPRSGSLAGSWLHTCCCQFWDAPGFEPAPHTSSSVWWHGPLAPRLLSSRWWPSSCWHHVWIILNQQKLHVSTRLLTLSSFCTYWVLRMASFTVLQTHISNITRNGMAVVEKKFVLVCDLGSVSMSSGHGISLLLEEELSHCLQGR